MRFVAQKQDRSEAPHRRIAGWAAAGVLAAALSAAAADAPPPAPSYTTSWLGNTFGGRNKGWTQMDIKDMAVSASGQVVAVTWWEEMHKEVALYDRSGKNKKISGANSVACEIVGDRLFYAHTGGGKPTRANYVIAYHLNGQKAGEVTVSSPSSFAPILGLAASPDGSRLYVSDRATETVQIFDLRALTKQSEFFFLKPRKLTCAPDGSLWIIQDGAGAGNLYPGKGGRIHHVSPTGENLGSTIADVLLPQAIRRDNQGRLLVADGDATRNHIRIYDSANGKLLGTFGRSILDDVPGKVEPDKFDHPTGVGMDAAGNWYVAWNGPPTGGTASDGQGAVLRCLSPGKKLLWESLGLEFIDAADADPADDTQVFTKNERFVMDYSKPAGKQWTWAGYTVNRRDYPNDPRFLHPHVYMTQIQSVNGKRLMATAEMEQDITALYRFDGEIAVPCFLLCGKNGSSIPPGNPGKQMWWYDKNGDGNFQPEEFTVSDNVKWRMAYLDAKGGLWHILSGKTVVHFALQGFDKFGAPVYDPQNPTHTIAIPTAINDIFGFEYDAAHDRAFIGGKTERHPNMDRKEVGATLARIDNLTTEPKEAWAITCPAGAGTVFSAMCWEGDYLFGATSRDAKIFIFDVADGSQVGTLSPGPEVNRASGWLDVRQAIRAHRRANGEYLVFAEEDAYAKVLVYQWSPPTLRQP